MAGRQGTSRGQLVGTFSLELVRLFRQNKSLHCLEAFLLVASGVDTVAGLAAAMGCTQSQASRMVSKLTGRGRWHQGQWIQSTFALVDRRQHPHQRGQQLFLSANGRQVLTGPEG